MSHSIYPRNLIGYAGQPPHANWPNHARIAIQFVLNYEEGAENCVLHGDPASEQFLSEIIGAVAYADRHMSMESIYEYGSRAGVWRILHEFEKRQLPLTIFGVGMALERHPQLAQTFIALGHELACHGYRWIHYQNTPENIEREHMVRCIEIIQKITGSHPKGWYTGRDSPNTLRLVADEGNFLYASDYYGDDLPFWLPITKTNGEVHNQLIIPYTLDTNDMRFANGQGFITSEHFYQYLRDAFDVLYAEGEENPKMLSVGLHCRLIGRPGRFKGLQRFLDYIQQHDKVWITTRENIANHWIDNHPPSMH